MDGELGVFLSLSKKKKKRDGLVELWIYFTALQVEEKRDQHLKGLFRKVFKWLRREGEEVEEEEGNRMGEKSIFSKAGGVEEERGEVVEEADKGEMVVDELVIGEMVVVERVLGEGVAIGVVVVAGVGGGLRVEEGSKKVVSSMVVSVTMSMSWK